MTPQHQQQTIESTTNDHETTDQSSTKPRPKINNRHAHPCITIRWTSEQLPLTRRNDRKSVSSC
jgi:hypothetical protein